MKLRVLVVGLVLLLLVLGGCARAESQEEPTEGVSSQVRLTASDSGSTVELLQGQYVIVRLRGGVTGWSWQVPHGTVGPAERALRPN